MDPNSAGTIARRLQDDIRHGRLPPGSILHQEELAARFAVSRQPIRLAIEILRASGLVAARHDRSVEVVGMSADLLRDLLAIRIVVEREALALAIPLLSDRDIRDARHLQEKIEIETDASVLEELDCAFHAALYKPCGNARLLKLIDDLRREDRRPYKEQPIGSASRAKWSREHRRLLRAGANRDAVSAATALENHLANLRRD